ncbi:MAG: WbqC family protein [Planctomycetota bacterium]|jgi:hypothetical protein
MSAHQPNFLPYLGFFDKMKKSDVFVIRDEVQFAERDYHHRNKIRTDGSINTKPQCKWIRVPVAKERKHIRHIMIRNEVEDKNVPWNIFMLRQIKSNYETAPFFRKYYPDLEGILRVKTRKLIDLSMEIIDFLKDCFNIKTEVVYASELGYEKTNDASEDLVGIAKAVNADEYLSGVGGRAYLNQGLFRAAGVGLQFQSFTHPVYRQRYFGFVPNLAAIDALFNVGNIFREGVTDGRDHEDATVRACAAGA